MRSCSLSAGRALACCRCGPARTGRLRPRSHLCYRCGREGSRPFFVVLSLGVGGAPHLDATLVAMLSTSRSSSLFPCGLPVPISGLLMTPRRQSVSMAKVAPDDQRRHLGLGSSAPRRRPRAVCGRTCRQRVEAVASLAWPRCEASIAAVVSAEGGGWTDPRWQWCCSRQG